MKVTPEQIQSLMEQFSTFQTDLMHLQIEMSSLLENDDLRNILIELKLPAIEADGMYKNMNELEDQVNALHESIVQAIE
jgi:hypothetical protein